jgi:small subunit ribosomal protein S4
MTRITCKRCRRSGESLCGREKCAFKNRPSTPGIPDSARKHKSAKSEYGEQLRGKQKVKFIYGLREKQFANYIAKAMSTKTTDTSGVIYSLLESRLDNVVFKSGIANTRALARQLVNHGHITVNSRKVNIPSYSVKEGEVIGVREGSKTSTYFTKLAEKFDPQTAPWITADAKNMAFTIKSSPKDLDKTLNLSTIIEFYSR